MMEDTTTRRRAGAPPTAHRIGSDDGLRRSVALLQAFRREQGDPETTYRLLAADAVARLRAHADLAGALAVDVGGGPGYVAEAMRDAGARCITLDLSVEELHLHGRTPTLAALGSGVSLPLRTGSVDVTCSYNTIEHVPQPAAVLDELVRVTRPGGTIDVSVTNWFSPWGGHETSPWHYLGGERAARRYELKHGHPPKNRYGVTLFRVSIAALLSWACTDPRVSLVDARPRYYPPWSRWVVRIPGLREVATWNLAMVLVRR
jgi:SAM-dependent methyltransferase